jgi:hypothetical protein
MVPGAEDVFEVVGIDTKKTPGAYGAKPGYNF